MKYAKQTVAMITGHCFILILVMSLLSQTIFECKEGVVKPHELGVQVFYIFFVLITGILILWLTVFLVVFLNQPKWKR